MQNTIPTKLIGRRYVLQDELGAGAMGSVNRALDRLTGRAVALKRVSIPVNQLEFGSQGGDAADIQLTLAQEFKVLASLRHPNIISVLDYGFDEGQPYVTMELLENADSLFDGGRDISLEEKHDLLIQTLQAIIYLHRRNILHRDLKPRNVLVIRPAAKPGENSGGRAQVKVLDFGLSIRRDEVRSGEVAGTPSYMAPELWMGKPASKASDLWAFGVMAYELYAGERPFRAPRSQDLYKMIRTHIPDLDALPVDDDIRLMIGRLLAKDAADRYADASEVLSLLRSASHTKRPGDATAMRESFLQAASFVGRDEELTLLSAELGKISQGRGSAWLIGGESGVGKSRLLEEVRTVALVGGAQVLRGQANREGNLPYAIWRDALRWLSLTTDLDQREASILKKLVPDIGTLLNRDVPDAPEVAAQADQARLLLVVEQVFRRQRVPLVVMLEDLHWTDNEALALLGHLSRIVTELPLMLVGSFRDDESPNLPVLLPTMNRMQLKRLGESGIGELVEAMVGPKGRTPELLELLQRETEGNVFFLVEMVRALAEEAGELDRVGAGPLPTHVLAVGVEGIVQRRLNRVPEWARLLLQVAAVAGRQLDLDVIRDVMQELDETANLEALLSDCADAAVLAVQEGEWYFAHNKLRDGVLAALSADVKKDLHGRIAKAMPSNYQYWAAIAYHAGQAGDIAMEEHAAALGGEQALRDGAFQSARDLLSRALELQDQTGQPKRKQATLAAQLGNAYLAMMHIDDAKRAYEDSLRLAREANYHWGAAMALYGLGNAAHDEGDTNAAAAQYLKAMKTASDIRAVPVMLNVLAGMASLLSEGGDKVVALEFASLVLNNPAATGQSHYLAERLVAELELELAPDVVAAGLAAGKVRSLREVVGRILEA